MAFHVYIMACASNTAIYVGATSHLHDRVFQHKSGEGSLHTSKYRIRKLVYFEEHETLATAVQRERRLKRWNRAWKNQLIETHNPNWADLAMETSFI